MAQSPDHPELVFLEARQSDGDPMYTVGRRGKKPRLIVLHDMEANERSDTAENTAQYFHTGAGGRSVSSHYCVDDNSVIQCVLLKDGAWTVGNSVGNDEGINWEMAGFARQTRAEWLDAFGMNMFRQMRPIVLSDSQRYGIPVRTLSDAEIRAGWAGVTTHWQLGRIYGGTDHTDPGPNFPMDVWLSIMLEDERKYDVTSFVVDGSKPQGQQPVFEWLGTNPATGKQRLAAVAVWDPVYAMIQGGAAVAVTVPSINPAWYEVITEDPCDCACGDGGGLTEDQVRDVAREEIADTTLKPPTD